MNQAYQNDPDTKQLIEVMIHMMEKLRFTPFEMKQAAVYAAMMFENRHIRPMIMMKEELGGQRDG